MARTWQVIYNEMVSAVQAEAAFITLEPSEENAANFLLAIKSKSKIAIWRAIIFAVSIYHYMQELLMDEHLAEVNQRASEGEYGTINWWRSDIKNYQHGDLLTVIDGRIGYSIIDEAKRIISYAAPRRVGGSVEIKVAGGVAPNYVALDYAQRAGVNSYAVDKAAAGENIIIVSQAADLLKFIGDIYYNATAGLATVKSNVEAAVADYLANLQFAGELKINGLIDAVQSVPGVIDISPSLVEAREFDGAFVTIERNYIPKAGYMKIDPDHALADNLNYIAA